jgi:uncharacterized protein (TIGR00369 family)
MPRGGRALNAKEINMLVPYTAHLGLTLSEATAQKVVGQLLIKPEFCNHTPNVHGGVIMSLGDALGAIGAYLNLPDGNTHEVGTTTIESKTNFIKPAMVGDILHGTSIPLSLGRRLSVWQTDIVRGDGKRVAVVTQTQIYL